MDPGIGPDSPEEACISGGVEEVAGVPATSSGLATL